MMGVIKLSKKCKEYNFHKSLTKVNKKYWKTPEGVRKRIESLSLHFTYRLVNNAFEIIGKKRQVNWLKWRAFGDDRFCPTCLKNARGRKNGLYRPQWFIPSMPAHVGCRCQWELRY
jgi:hypothetical protein